MDDLYNKAFKFAQRELKEVYKEKSEVIKEDINNQIQTIKEIMENPSLKKKRCFTGAKKRL
ncbi:hypothetical protein [Helicobacter suis]|uniref:Uncharacterized protein n=1 Tax=Helicobacter suis TaxID=104628 RepID=A0A6J4CWN3_9HELI|nr:hypothetical protein [Helicobacter suis]BCD69751.1 hypothetical protein SNTW_03960 [Helicobacter suis]